MDTLLYNAIFALDVYNRGPNKGISIDGGALGVASTALERSLPEIGFFAQSYSLNGQTIISYRGTDEEIPGGDGTTWEQH